MSSLSQVSAENVMQWHAKALAACIQWHKENKKFVVKLGIKNILPEAKWWDPVFDYVH